MAVALVQLTLGLALLSGLRVDVRQPAEVAQRLIELTLPKVVQPPPPRPAPTARHSVAAAPKMAAQRRGGSPGPTPAHSPASVVPLVAVHPSAAPSGGGSGSGPAMGAGAGGGAGGSGYGGDGEGGTDLEQVAGAILPSDYPRHLREAGIGGRVSFVFTVGPNGRVGRCTITRSSGVPELDLLTCRLIEQRFVYRPSTDRYGRPIADEVDGEHDWIAR